MLLAAVLPALAACALAAPAGLSSDDQQPVIASVIVKPRTASSADEVLRVARRAVGPEAGVRYARPLSGNAHILYLTGPASRDATPALLERLQATGAFEYVEVDSTMKAQ
jgi:hypothetical protein